MTTRETELLAANATLKAENEALRKDAERYRWLRYQCDLLPGANLEVCKFSKNLGKDGRWAPLLEPLDAAIDTAMSQGEK